MNFYCPKCQAEYEVEPTGSVTTKMGRVAYKANCPQCGQDMAEFATFDPQTTPRTTTPSAAPPLPPTPISEHQDVSQPTTPPLVTTPQSNESAEAVSESEAQAVLDAAASNISSTQ